VREDARVAGDEGDLLRFGLGDEQAVEGVALRATPYVHVRKASVCGGVIDGYREQRESLRQQLLRPTLDDLELAERRLDRDLKERPGAEERVPRAGYRFARRPG
jgi:hypothetical protein